MSRDIDCDVCAPERHVGCGHDAHRRCDEHRRPRCEYERRVDHWPYVKRCADDATRAVEAPDGSAALMCAEHASQAAADGAYVSALAAAIYRTEKFPS